MTERFGHRIVIMVGLVVMSGLIFITAFAPSIQVLCVGQVLVGIPWGIFSIMGSAYASEVCPLALRGYLLSFVNICWVLVCFIFVHTPATESFVTDHVVVGSTHRSRYSPRSSQ